MRTLKVSVPEAASSVGTITFKILVMPPNTDSSYPIFRTFSQVRWLHHKLQSAFVDHVIPPLPDPLSEKLCEDVDQVEQKRVQIERFLQRICHRNEFATSEAVLWFVGTEMTHLESVDSKKATLGFLLGFDNIIKPSYDRGLRIYRPAENVEENDQGEFQRRQDYVLAMEHSFTRLLDSGVRVTKERERLADNYSQLGDATMEVLSSKYRLGDGQRIDNRERHQALDEEMQVFGVLTDDVRLSMRRQVKAETFYFVDLVQEYKGMLQGLKDVMNVRTDRLSDYVSATKKVARKKIQVEQAIVRSATSPAPELIEKANLNLEDATAKLEEAREDFKRSQDVVTRELQRYGEDKAKEWQASVQDYAQKQIMYEREKLNALEKAWDSIQHLRNGGPSGVDGRGASSEPSARSRSYWPSGLGVPFAPDLMRESRTSQPVQNDVITSLKPLAFEPESNLYQGRLPQNAGIGSGNVSGLNSGYNSGYNSDYTSGYNSGDQDEGMRSGQGYFPATKLSRSGSGPRTNKAAGTEPNKNGSVPAMTTGSIVTPLTPTDTGDRPLAAAPPPPPPPPSKNTFIVEDTVKIKDGYDPLMVRPGFAD
ncbi:MAG: Vps5 C terminal like-domain-containing protein [Benniella sp.]|nr:MAG: Vps5 C terminal like-domain-containing protein [Benniella sp.]